MHVFEVLWKIEEEKEEGQEELEELEEESTCRCCDL
jgi:hypothetical protein